MAKNVYLAVKNGGVIFHTDLDAMKQMDGIDKPALTVTEEEFLEAGSIARLENGKIVLGLSDKELEVIEARKRRLKIDRELEIIDRKSERAVRAVSYAMATGESVESEDLITLKNLEDRAIALRAERSGLPLASD